MAARGSRPGRVNPQKSPIHPPTIVVAFRNRGIRRLFVERRSHGFLCPPNMWRVCTGDRGENVDFLQVLPVALGLVLIIEGAMPFISPHRWRNMLALVAQMDDRTIRNIGLGSMLLGVAMLYLFN